eukprot:2306711-Amphidinium_carterae.1
MILHTFFLIALQHTAERCYETFGSVTSIFGIGSAGVSSLDQREAKKWSSSLILGAATLSSRVLRLSASLRQTRMRVLDRLSGCTTQMAPI